MTISASCDECGKKYKVPDDKAGKRIKCKECGATMRIPEGEDDSDIEEEEPVAPRRGSAPAPLVRRGGGSGEKPAKKSQKSAGNGAGLVIGLVVGLFLVVGLVVGGVVMALNSRAGADGDPVVAQNDPAAAPAAPAEAAPATGTTPAETASAVAEMTSVELEEKLLQNRAAVIKEYNGKTIVLSGFACPPHDIGVVGADSVEVKLEGPVIPSAGKQPYFPAFFRNNTSRRELEKLVYYQNIKVRGRFKDQGGLGICLDDAEIWDVGPTKGNMGYISVEFFERTYRLEAPEGVVIKADPDKVLLKGVNYSLAIRKGSPASFNKLKAGQRGIEGFAKFHIDTSDFAIWEFEPSSLGLLETPIFYFARLVTVGGETFVVTNFVHNRDRASIDQLAEIAKSIELKN